MREFPGELTVKFLNQCDPELGFKRINGMLVAASLTEDGCVMVLEHYVEKDRPYRITHISGGKVKRSECYHIVDNEGTSGVATIEDSKIDVSKRGKVSAHVFKPGRPKQEIKFQVPPDSELRQLHASALAAAQTYVRELLVEQGVSFPKGVTSVHGHQ